MPKKRKSNHSSLFEVLSSSRCKPEQVARWSDRVKSPTYTLLRELSSLDELNEYDHYMAIWRENKTLTYVTPCGDMGRPILNAGQRSMCLAFGTSGPTLSIVGKTDNAVAETATYFINLEKPSTENTTSRLYIRGGDFRAVGSQCLTRIFDMSPSRDVMFSDTTLSVEQCTVLATRSHPTRLSFFGCTFDDGGTAFVDALVNRDSSIGAIMFEGKPALTEVNMKRLLQEADMIEHLDLPLLTSDKLALLPFSAQVESLNYEIHSSSLLEANIQSLNIATKKLSVTIYHEGQTFPTDMALAFLQRLSEIGHFVELQVGFYLHDEDEDAPVPDCIVQALIRVALANAHLKVLNLCDSQLDWGPHIGTVFSALKDHKGLCTVKVNVDDDDEAFGPDLSYLRQFLSHNRNATVMDEDGIVYSDDDLIDELYALNRFYRGSADLAIEPSVDRPLLVAATLLESASNDFQRCALLMANHVDVLCEAVQLAE